jgi:glycosyltransferase involved in cell wall biosynthesis
VHIGIDACTWSNRRGFGRYTRDLVTALVQGFPEHDYTLVVDSHTAGTASFPAGAKVEVVPLREQPTRAASAQGARGLRDLWRMSWAVARVRPEVFFFPAVYSFFPVCRSVRTVVTFHDAIAERHPGLIFPRRLGRLLWGLKTALARRQADRIVTVSESARAQIAAAFGCPAASIAVVGEGVHPAFRRLDDPARVREALARYRLPGEAPLLLVVGGLSPHKNLQGLFRALAAITGAPWHLAVVGDHANDSFHGCYPELLALSRQLGLEHRLTFTGFVPDDDLVALYTAATMLVFPSFEEGFGLPAVEAMACGVPVAASRGGSLPEVLGESGTFFNPHDPADMAGTISDLLERPDLRRRQAELGLRRARRYSWTAAAEILLRLFEELVYGPPQTSGAPRRALPAVLPGDHVLPPLSLRG